MTGWTRSGRSVAGISEDRTTSLLARQHSQHPELLVLEDGREIDRIVGVQSKSAIARRLERLMA